MPFLGARGAAPDPRGAAQQPIPGVTEWRCPRNGVHVVEVHYTADPAKRDPAWKRDAQRGMPPRGWQREFEIAFDLAGGERSEEHTSELQSLRHLVCRLLLE